VNSAGEKVLEIKTSASGKAQKFVGENALALRLQQTTLAMVDTLDQLIIVIYLNRLEKQAVQKLRSKLPNIQSLGCYVFR
jgi:hypothetical protein